jgi:polygalacturonase
MSERKGSFRNIEMTEPYLKKMMTKKKLNKKGRRQKQNFDEKLHKQNTQSYHPARAERSRA